MKLFKTSDSILEINKGEKIEKSQKHCYRGCELADFMTMMVKHIVLDEIKKNLYQKAI